MKLRICCLTFFKNNKKSKKKKFNKSGELARQHATNYRVKNQRFAPAKSAAAPA